MSSSRPEPLAIIGIGEVPAGWYPGTSSIELSVDVVKSALEDAAIPKQELEAFFLVPPLARERDEYHLTFCRLQEEMGLHGSAKINMQIASWGASPILAIETAGSMIRRGEVTTAIIYNAQSFSGASDQDLYWFFERNNRGFHREWERHFGISMESMAALVTRRYLHETGTTEESLAAVSSALRKSARLSNLSRFPEELTVADILQSDIEATPLRSLECGALADGATAFIVTSAERASGLTDRQPIFVLGTGHSGSPRLSFIQKPDADFTRLGFRAAVDSALSAAGRTLKDIDLFELYASFPVFYILQLEELGLCKRGEGAAMFLDSEGGPGRKLPVSTNGGIQQGNSGLGVAMSTITESVRQLRNEAGMRQVDRARNALVSGFGNQMLDTHALVLGTGANA